MQLKIASITNLTDARFFSAIGAHYLGFCFDALDKNNINIAKAKEIINWLYNPVIVGQFGQHQTQEEIQFIADEIGINDIQIPFNHPQQAQLGFEKFLTINDWTLLSDCLNRNEIQPLVDSLVLKIQPDDIANNTLKNFIKNNKVFIETAFTKQNILPLVETLHPYGIQITCHAEQKSGISKVDEYAEILEVLGF